jgi:hypothetical protein
MWELHSVRSRLIGRFRASVWNASSRLSHFPMWLQLANVRFSPPAAISCHEAMGQDGSTRVPASGSAQSLDRCGRLQSAPMRYLTATGSGVVTAIGTAILWRIVRFVLPLAVPPFLSRIGATQSRQRKRRRGNRVRCPQNRAAMSGVPPAPCASESTVAPAEIIRSASSGRFAYAAWCSGVHPRSLASLPSAPAANSASIPRARCRLRGMPAAETAQPTSIRRRSRRTRSSTGGCVAR